MKKISFIKNSNPIGCNQYCDFSLIANTISLNFFVHLGSFKKIIKLDTVKANYANKRLEN